MDENNFHTFSQNICAYIHTLPYDENYRAIVESIVQVFPGPANIKNNTTLSYVMINQFVMKNYGFYFPENMIGKTLRDVSKKIRKSSHPI